MGTRYTGTAEEARALDAYIKLMRSAESVSARVVALLAPAGLTVSQFGVLDALYHLGPLAQGELGRKILKSSGNITLVVDNLEKRGLVARERSMRDRRSVRVSLTRSGRDLFRRVMPGHVQAIVKEMRVLRPREQKTLSSLCKAVGTGRRE